MNQLPLNNLHGFSLTKQILTTRNQWESFTHALHDVWELPHSNSHNLLALLKQIEAKSDEVTHFSSLSN